MNEINYVAIYLRLSRNEENLSIEEVFANHRKTLLQMCEQNNWEYRIYEEVASSVNIRRKQLTAMLDDVKEGLYNGVLVMDIDRLSRDVFDAPSIFKILHDARTSIITPVKTYDWEKDDDTLLLHIQSLVAAQEYKQIKKRMTKGKRDASELGFFVHGEPPFGYSKNSTTRKLEPNKEKEHVEFIFNSIINEMTVSDVYHELNRLGVKTSNGSKFAFNAIIRIINNEAYKGTLVYNRYKVTDERYKNSDKRKTIERPREEWKRVPNAHEAIIDAAKWEKANKIVNTYKFSKPRSKNTIYPTTKLIFCGNCGKTQGCQYHPHIDKFYLKICRHCKNRTYLYTPILEIIKEKVSNQIPQILKQIHEVQQNDNSAENIYKIEQLNKRIRIAESAIKKLLPAYEEDIITIAEFKTRKAEREEEIRILKAELEHVESQDPKDKIADLNDIHEKVVYLLQNWKCIDGTGLTDEQVNRALHHIVERIEWKYGKDDVEPELKIIFKE